MDSAVITFSRIAHLPVWISTLTPNLNLSLHFRDSAAPRDQHCENSDRGDLANDVGHVDFLQFQFPEGTRNVRSREIMYIVPQSNGRQAGSLPTLQGVLRKGQRGGAGVRRTPGHRARGSGGGQRGPRRLRKRATVPPRTPTSSHSAPYQRQRPRWIVSSHASVCFVRRAARIKPSGELAAPRLGRRHRRTVAKPALH